MSEPIVQLGAVNLDELAEQRHLVEISPVRVTLAYSRPDKSLFETYITGLYTPFRSVIPETDNEQILKSQIVLEALRRAFESCAQVAA